MRILYFLLLIISNNVFSQSGKINGNVIDAGSGRSLDGATVTLIEKSKTIAADQNGNFSFVKLEAGTYSIRCSFSGHVEKIVSEVIVKQNDQTAITISLEQRKADAVIVAATRTKAAGETVASLLVAQKNSANVSDGITAQQIKQTPDKSTSDVLKRVSGASIQDDRFAIIRGLNDRYNAAFINGGPLPSSESDRKAFAFDIFPAAILDNLVIFKTATPDKTGEFAGGIIDISTKSIPSKSFTTISFGTSVNTLITGKDRYYSENKGKKDWIGLDDGTRGIPAGIPSSYEIKNNLSFAQRAELAKLYNNFRWGVKHDFTTKPNYSFQLTKGFNIQRKQEEFMGALFSVNYNKNYSFSSGERNSFDSYDFSAPYHAPIQKNKYRDSIYNDEVILAVLANFSVKINNRNNITWKNNLSINTDNRLIKRIGNYDFESDSLGYVKDIVRWYTSNQIFASQLAGEHSAGRFKTKINWLAAYSKVKRDIPVLARTSYTGSYPDVTNLTASLTTPPRQTSGTGSMFSSNTNENIKSIKVDITQPYTFMKNTQNFIKIGAGYQLRKREFASRTLGLSPYDDPGNGVSYDHTLDGLPDDQLFLPNHIGIMKNGKGGFLLADGTLANSDYTASSATTHAYIMSDQRFFKKLRLIYGVRMESFNQKLTALKNLNDTINLNTTITDFLPSVNLVYALTTKMNLRLSYAATINRPEFRELAPFLFFDYLSNFSIAGYDKNKRAKINNYDFRYEFFPGKAQLFSISAFYKHFKDPIEFTTQPNTTSQAIYANSTSAKVYGIEVEFRTLISTLLGIKREKSLLSKFTLSANAALIKSTVKLDSLFGFPASQLVTDRALQGQSPYIINTSLAFNDERIGLSSTLSVNRVGDRVAIAGPYDNPDMYEKARTVIDFQLAKTFLKNAVELKFNAKDILAQNIGFYLDYDKSKSYNSSKDRFATFTRAPRIYSITATIKL
ncbi:TonB-dependent receptor [soil metagenome]